MVTSGNESPRGEHYIISLLLTLSKLISHAKALTYTCVIMTYITRLSNYFPPIQRLIMYLSIASFFQAIGYVMVSKITL